jgi:hypothetical protein
MGAGGSAGAPLKGHVTAARLETESGQLVATIPTSTATLYLDVVVALNMDLPSRDEYVARARHTAHRKGERSSSRPTCPGSRASRRRSPTRKTSQAT